MTNPHLDNLRRGARRLELLRDLVATFEAPADRKHLIMGLRRSKLISDDATTLLIEHFELATA